MVFVWLIELTGVSVPAEVAAALAAILAAVVAWITPQPVAA